MKVTKHSDEICLSLSDGMSVIYDQLEPQNCVERESVNGSTLHQYSLGDIGSQWAYSWYLQFYTVPIYRIYTE